MSTKAYKLKLSECVRITPRAYKLRAFDGSSVIIPAVCYLGEVPFEENAHYVAAWILDRKPDFQNYKKDRYYVEGPSLRARRAPEVIYHHPDHVEPVEDNRIDELRR